MYLEEESVSNKLQTAQAAGNDSSSYCIGQIVSKAVIR